MRTPHVASRRLFSALVAAAILLLAVHVHGASAAPFYETEFGSYLKALDLIDAMRSSLLAASDAEKGAVMAGAEEESKSLASEARNRTGEVERSRLKLRDLLEERDWAREKALLDEFDRCWRAYLDLEDEILGLAVHNTNLKAASLSRDRGIELLRRFDAALSDIQEATVGSADTQKVLESSCHALDAARMIQILHSPHIAEADPGRMDALEAEMGALDEKVREALAALGRIPDVEASPAFRSAGEIYVQYEGLTREVIAESRRNTNVLSLSLSLGQKRKVAACCLDALQSLRDMIRDHKFMGTK